MLKTFISTLVISFGITQSTFAIGGVDGGGGKGVLCKDSTGAIASVELLDLWEARTLYSENQSTTIPTLGLKNGVYAVLDVLKNAYPYRGKSLKPGCTDQECILQNLQQRADLFLNDASNIKRLHGVTLELTDDSYEIAKPSDCEIAQIVNYQPSGTIIINQDLYEKMNLLNQIALIAHESFYAMLRTFALETNSVRTRRAIGYAISGELFNLVTPDLPKNHLFCYDLGIPYAPTNISFFLNKDSSTNTEGLAVYPETSHSSKFIGLSKNLFNFPMIDAKEFNMMESGKCNRDGADNMFISMNMGGPVEFDREIQIDWVCKSGIYSAYLTDHKPGTHESITTPLTCKSIQ